MRWAMALLLWGVSGFAWATTYTVTNTKNSGAGSLRQAILDVNAHTGYDRITFAAGLSGKTIAPSNPLPAITAEATTIDGDLNNDGKPDIQLDGYKLSSGAGLVVRNAVLCKIVGLAIVACPDTGLRLIRAAQAEVRSCYLGVSLIPGLSNMNGNHAGVAGEQLEVLTSDHVRIGGSAVRDRNCFLGGHYVTGNVGLRLVGSRESVVVGNYFGLAPEGTYAWGSQNIAVRLEPAPGGRTCSQNGIGGEVTTGEPNYFAGGRYGVYLHRSTNNYVRGSYYGLAKNRSTALPVKEACVYIGESSSDNTVGGGLSERNVFVSEQRGVTIAGPNALRTRVESNYFGTNGAGTAQRIMGVCVDILQSSGVQYIGSADPSNANHLVPNGTVQPTGVELWYSGAGPRIQDNIFGELPNGDPGATASAGIYCVGSSPVILGNRITRAQRGLDVWHSSSSPQAYNNRFADCPTAVHLQAEAHCRLGNLSNASSTDNGGNLFSAISDWFVYNDTPNAVKAEGNDFGTTSNAAIRAKVYDRLDNASLGRVDYSPLVGGIPPTGGTDAVMVSNAAAIPMAGGAEIVFALSSPADVTISVLNIAGRPVATVAQERATEAGLQRVVWNGLSATGTRAPNGAYLVVVEARSATGEASRAMAHLNLGR